MIRKTSIVFFVLVVTFGMTGIQFAMSQEHDHDMDSHHGSDQAEKGSKAIEVNNKTCPVSGEKVGMMGPPAHYEYNGKIYNFCCPGCFPEFKKNPEKYTKKAEESATGGHSAE